MTEQTTCGVFFVHSIPRALCSHAQWALTDVLGYSVRVDWTAQPLGGSGLVRGEFGWVGRVGAGAALATALRGWDQTRYEVTEDCTGASVGGRWSHTPELGIFHAQTDLYGNTVVPENRLRLALGAASPQEVQRALSLALGTAWDVELEPYRYAGEDAPVKWAHRAG
ncbi:DUF3145 family protein [Buchananella felis]|uniref:DUF3145 family protein n=1 Tax=Buchananella felis TaxID=3231492 RepID=UPI003528B85A